MSLYISNPWRLMTPNKAVHWTTIPLRSIAASELQR